MHVMGPVHCNHFELVVLPVDVQKPVDLLLIFVVWTIGCLSRKNYCVLFFSRPFHLNK